MKLLPLLICVQLWLPLAAQVKMTVAPNVIRITGPDWTLLYGTRRTWFPGAPQLLMSDGDRAWFSHGPRLRLLDTRQGRVIGRWLFPGEIVGVTPQSAGRIQVEVEERSFGPSQTVTRHAFAFDAQQPSAPYWPTPPLFWGSLSVCEPQFFGRPPASMDCRRILPPQPADRIEQALPALEDMARRDPFSPWFALTVGQLLRMKGDPRAADWLNRAAHTSAGNPDFLEQFALAEVLERLGRESAAATAFEAGFQDFLARGHHPRLFLSEDARETLFGSSWPRLAAAGIMRTHLERVYRLAPTAEGAALAWDEHARIAERNGEPAEAALWRSRAREAQATSLYVREPAATQLVDLPLRVGLPAALGALLLLLACSSKYFRSRPSHSEPSEFRFFLTEYWTWPERASFLFLALTAWLALGVAGGYLRGVLRLDSLPAGARFGSFAGPSTVAYFENQLPSSPEQQILVNLARHTGPVSADAVPTREQLERALGLRVSAAQAVLWAAGGPITAGSFLKPGLRYMLRPPRAVQATLILTCLLLPLAIFIFLVPRQGTFGWTRQEQLWDALVPSSAWKWLGGPILLAFGFFLVQGALVYSRGAPCFVARTCDPNLTQHLQRGYGLATAIVPDLREDTLWLVGVPLGIWVANLLLLALKWRRTRVPPSVAE